MYLDDIIVDTIAIKDWPIPRGIKDLQAFLGTVGYYRQYLQNFATNAQSLHRLTAKGVQWTWRENKQMAFNKIKFGPTTVPILGYPNPNDACILGTDASDVGAVLSQIQGTERITVYLSQTLAPSEENYCVTRKELLAVGKAVKHFDHIFMARSFDYVPATDLHSCV